MSTHRAVLQSNLKRRPDRKPPKPPIEPDPVLNALTYVLGVESSVSAGIYKVESGEYRMLRNLISNRRMAPETYTEPWDFKDNDGNIVPPGTYPVLLQTNDLKYEFEGTIGNTSTDKTGANRHKSFQFAVHMAIHGTTGYYCTNYTELFTNTHRFNTASPQSRTAIHEKYKTLQMTKYVATDGTFVYSCGADPVRITKNVTSISIANPGVITGPANTFFDFRTGDKITVLSANGAVLVGGQTIVGQSFTITKISETQVSIGAATTGTAATSGSVQSAFKSFTFANKVSDNSEHKGFTSVSVVRPTHGGGLTFTHAIDYIQGGNEVLPTGCALSGNYYFVARGGMNSIRVMNKTTGAFVREITTFTNPRELEADYSGSLWVIHGTNNATKHTVNSDGTLSVATVTLSGVNKALFFAAAKDSSKIFVGDQFGSSFTLRCYNNSTGAYINTLGSGESVTNPEVKHNKFFLADINNGVDNTFKGFAECDDDGNIWVGDAGNSRILKFSSAYAPLDTIMWLPHSYSVAVDKANPNSVFNEWKEFDIDYTKPLLPNNASWVFVRNFAGSIPAGYYRDYTRDVLTSVVTKFGHTYGFLKHTTTFEPIIVELVPDGPMRLTNKSFGEHAKVYFNADGSVTRVTDVVNGVQTVYNQPMTGIDGSNNPVWGTEVVIDTITGITGTDPVDRGGAKTGQRTTSGKLVYFDREGEQNGHGQGYHLGIRKGGNWLVKTSKATGKTYTGDFPKDDKFDTGNNVNAAGAGGDLFVNGNDIIWNYIGEFFKNAQANFGKHFSDNGLLLGTFGTWKKNFNQESHAELESRRLDGSQPTLQALAGNAFSGELARVGDNLYFHYNDESLNGHSGIHRVKISGFDTIDVVESTITVPPTVEPDPEEPENPPSLYDTLLTTTALKEPIKKRIETDKKPFYNKSDFVTNSPDDGARTIAETNRLINNPLIDLFKPANPIYVESTPPVLHGIKVMDAAFLYWSTGNIAAGNAAVKAIMAQATEPTADFSNLTKFPHGVINDLSPGFYLFMLLARNTTSASLTWNLFSSTQKATFLNWVWHFGKWGADEMNPALNAYYTNRAFTASGGPTVNIDNTMYTFVNPANRAQKIGISHDNGYDLPRQGKVYNNRFADMAMGIASAGEFCKKYGSAQNFEYLRKTAKLFYKENMIYAQFPNGLDVELERASDVWHKGLSYWGAKIFQLLKIALIQKWNGDSELINWTTKFGANGTQSTTNKSLKVAIDRYLAFGDKTNKYSNGSLWTFEGTPLTFTNPTASWYTVHDKVIAVLANTHYKNQYYKDYYSKNIPARASGSGTIPGFYGAGGSIPAPYLMYALNEDKI